MDMMKFHQTEEEELNKRESKTKEIVMKKNSKADFILNMPNKWENCENQQFSADFIRNMPKGDWKQALEDEKYLRENRNKGKFDCENQQFSADFILNMPKGEWKQDTEEEELNKRIEKLENDIDNLKHWFQFIKYYLCFLYVLGFTIAIVVMFSSCQEECLYNTTDQYNIDKTIFTPNGIEVDISGQQVDLAKLDKLVDEVDQCLLITLPNLTRDDRLSASCDKDMWEDFSGIGGFIVKIDPNWRMSHDLTRQLLYTEAPTESCQAKGISPTEECPCRWQSAVQDCNIVVVTPNLNNIKEAIVKVSLGCRYPWNNAAIASCMTSDLLSEEELSKLDLTGRMCWE